MVNGRRRSWAKSIRRRSSLPFDPREIRWVMITRCSRAATRFVLRVVRRGGKPSLRSFGEDDPALLSSGRPEGVAGVELVRVVSSQIAAVDHVDDRTGDGRRDVNLRAIDELVSRSTIRPGRGGLQLQAVGAPRVGIEVPIDSPDRRLTDRGMDPASGGATGLSTSIRCSNAPPRWRPGSRSPAPPRRASRYLVMADPEVIDQLRGRVRMSI
jgi:hypothetical protein